ncbi:hypothetical protein GY31_12675 [Lysinibacillus sphaericus]|uniref:hypothetical protein n=1 Tax=Lysinibacillus TaxID=400634 RepID=UPI00084ABC5A|nr:hypothetical protein [Lysinibacillus sphaericus]OEC01171.1 hypothetical protein GY31_12675 [Lysinibacillus sphaericus]
MTFVCTAKLWEEFNEVREINISPTYLDKIQSLLDSIPVSIEQELLDAIKAAMVVELDLDEHTLEISFI